MENSNKRTTEENQGSYEKCYKPRRQNDEISWKRLVVCDFDDVANFEVSPLDFLPITIAQNLHLATVELSVGPVSLLLEKMQESE